MASTRPEPPVIPSERSCPFDPPEEYARLREEEPVCPITFQLAPGDPEGWLVTRHEHVRQILADERFSHRTELMAPVVAPPFPMEKYEPQPPGPGSYSGMDGEEHAKYRRLLAGFFTLRRIQQHEPVLARIVDEALEEMAAMPRPVDLVPVFAEGVNSRSTAALLGLPLELINGLSDHLSKLMQLTYTMEEFIHHTETMNQTIREVIKDRMEKPRDDLFSQLIASGELTEEELVNMSLLTVVGSLDTNPNMLGLSTFALLEHPDQLERFRSDPSVQGTAADELLRYLTISQMGASRTALEDIEVGGTTVRAGQTVVVSLPAANRDPRLFENPDELNLGRNPRKHVAFGFGVHQCIGQHLARATIRISLNKLFARFPTLRLAVPAEEIPLRDRAVHYGVDSLPVTWDD